MYNLFFFHCNVQKIKIVKTFSKTILFFCYNCSTLETLIEASSLNNTTEHRLSLYGVYDGHGGAEVSEMLSNRILDFIVEHLNYQKKNNINTLEDVSRKNEFICLFQQFDKEILDDQMVKQTQDANVDW